VEVVDPDKVMTRGTLRKRLSELLVRRLIGAPVFGSKVAPIQKIVGKRPQDPIGKPVVIVLDLLLCKLNKPQGIPGFV